MVKKVEYSRGINSSQLILTTEEVDEKDSIEMFNNNEIPYFLNMKLQKKDQEMQFYYNITSKQSLEQILECKMLDYALAKKILISFDEACSQAENYMLSENNVVLLPELMFMEMDTEQVLYCYLPGYQVEILRQFKGLMEYLLQHLDHKDKKVIGLVYGVYQQVAEEKGSLHEVLRQAERHQAEIFDLNKWSETNRKFALDYNVLPAFKVSEENEDPKQVSAQELEENKYPQQIDLVASKECQKEDIHRNQFRIPQRNNDEQKKNKEREWRLYKEEQEKDREKKRRVSNVCFRKGKTTENSKLKQQNNRTDKEILKQRVCRKFKNFFRKKIYTDYYQTVEQEFFEEEMEPEPTIHNPTVCLMPKGDTQNLFVYQGTDRSRDFYCTIGKKILGSSSQYSDIYLPLPMVSRVHARIEVSGDGTYLEDMNSTNGTQVNGEDLNYRERRKLQKGDIISIAGESYTYVIVESTPKL